MPGRKSRYVATASVVVAAGLFVTPTVAEADPWGDGCGMGTAISAEISFAIDDVAQSHDGANNRFVNGYVVNVCRDTNNHAYLITVSNPSEPHNLIPVADASKTFTVSFTPDSTDVPLIAEGKAHIDGFTIAAAPTRTVSLDLRPMGWSDIYGDDCGNRPPLSCVANVSKASVDYARDIFVDVRYADVDSGAGGEGFQSLSGMTWSVGAYYFWFGATCPAESGESGLGLTLDMAGPHFMADGSTLNSGFATVFLPETAIDDCFGQTVEDFLTSAYLSRTEDGRTSIGEIDEAYARDPGLHFTVDSTPGGVSIAVPVVTFSRPQYTLASARVAYELVNVAEKKGLTVDPDGRLLAKIAKSSKKVCAANSAILYGIAKGNCHATLTSFSASDEKLGAKTIKFKIK